MDIKCRNDEEKAAVRRDREEGRLMKLSRTVANPIHPQIGQQLAQWLDRQPWDTFVTLTYGSYNPSPRSARRQVEKLLATARPRLAYWVTERGEKFGRVHNHALIQWRPGMEDDRVGPQLIQSHWEDWWRTRFGISEFETFEPGKGATGYLASYVTKKIADYDLWLPSHP